MANVNFPNQLNEQFHKLVLIMDSTPGRGVSAYERGGDARRKFWIKPLKETDLGVAQVFFDP